MKKFTLFFLGSLIFAFLIIPDALPQGYIFTPSSGTFTVLSGGASPSFTGDTDDGYMATPENIGFTFKYWGTDYTTFAVSTNGWMTLGQAAALGSTNDLSAGTPRPIIAPLWDDMDLQAFTNFTYKTEGGTPNRIFTAEWLNVKWNYNAAGSVISFQVKLYEGINKIEFIYRQEASAVNSGSASIGLAGPYNSEYISLDGTGVSPSLSWVTETKTLNTKPADGQVYSFTVNKTALSGIKTIKSAGGDYTNFNDAFKDLAVSGINGALTFNVDAGLMLTEDCIPLYASGSAINPITFQKSGIGANPVIKPTGGTSSNDAGIIIHGGSYITFNGIDITINSGLNVEYGYLVRNSSAVKGAQYNTVKNSKITLNRSNSSSAGILQTASSTGGGVTPTAAEGTNSYNHYYNITVENAFGGIRLNGNSTYPDLSCEIGIEGTGATTIGAATANDIGNGGAAGVNGIRATNQSGVKIFNCEVRNLTVTSTLDLYGINLETCKGSCYVYNNKVYNLTSTFNSVSPEIFGISVDVGSGHTGFAYNNVIYGYSHAVSPANATMVARGISFIGAGIGYIYYNSVRIGLGALPTNTALYVANGTLNIKNNIFANFSTAGATSKRYCCYISSGTINSSSNNILYINTAGNNNFTGYKTSDRQSIQVYAAAISPTAVNDGFETGSTNADPNFTSTTELTFAGATPARYGAVPIAFPEINSDITGAGRDGTYPTIGAYETTQALSDFTPPVISGVSVTSGLNPIISVTINDNKYTETNNAITRLWYRQTGSTGAYTGLDADSKPSGSINGIYTWNTSLSGLAKSSYEFYITARDNKGAGSNISANPIWSTSFAGFNAADPPDYAANPDAAAKVRSFSKTEVFVSGTYKVGTGKDYADMNAVTAALNGVTINGPLVFELTSAYNSESGIITLLNVDGTSDANTITIRPESGAGMRTINMDPGTGNAVLNIISGNHYIIDGREGGTGSTSALTIRNTRSTATIGPAIKFDSAISNKLSYINIESQNASTNSGVVFFTNPSGISGSDYNIIEYCKIHDRSDVSGVPVCCIYSNGSASASNDNNIIRYNEIYNFSMYGFITHSGSNWTISGNSFYNTLGTAITNSQTVVGFDGTGGGQTVSNNYMGGSGPNCSGTWNLSGTGAMTVIGLADYNGTNNSYISGNTICNIVQTNTIPGGLTVVFLWTDHNVLVEKNRIFNIGPNFVTTNAGSVQVFNYDFSMSTTCSFTFTNNQVILGEGYETKTAYLILGGSSAYGDPNYIYSYFNTFIVSGISNAVSNASSYVISGSEHGGAETHMNNIYYNNRTGGTGKHIVCAYSTAHDSYNNFNLYAGTNSSEAFMWTKSFAWTEYISFAQWKDSTGNDANGYFSLNTSLPVADLFNNPSTGNLDIITNYNKSWSLNSKGTPVSGISTDFSGNPRNTLPGFSTDIGSDEFTPSVPPPVVSTGDGINPLPNSNDFYYNGRLICNITFNGTGVNPNRLNLYYYSGVVPPNSAGKAINSYWDINAEGGSGYRYTITIYYSVNEIGSIPETNLRIVKSSDNGSNWEYLGGTQINGRVYYGLLESFSYFTLTNNDTPLPVEFVEFSYQVKGRDVELKWITMRETNNQGFYVEKRNAGTDLWSTLGFVKGAGNTVQDVTYRFVDKNIKTGKYEYRLKQVDYNGNVNYKTCGSTVEIGIPEVYSLSQNYPNPFNPVTKINFDLPAVSKVNVTIFDITGREIKTIINGFLEAGYYTETFNASDLSSGVYFYRIIAESSGRTYSDTKKMVLVR